MQVNITARRINISEQLKLYINEKLSKLNKYSTKIEEARVVFSLEKFNYISEIILTGKNFRMVATEKNEDLQSCFDKAASNIEEQLKKFRARAKEHKVKNLFDSLKKFSLKKKQKPSAPYIIKTDSYVTKPMSQEEAVSELELFDRQFMVFRNSDDDKVNVLYRRNDGNYGLIEP
jgi:putative sigma-54 modulation protein